MPTTKTDEKGARHQMPTLSIAREPLTIDEAAEQLKALDTADSRNAFEMGDVVLAAVPMATTEFDESTGQVKDQGVTSTLKELAAKAGMAWRTLEARRHVASRVPVPTRVGTVPFKTYRRIADLRDETQRSDLLKLVQSPNPDREDGRWTESAIESHLPKKPSVGSAPESADDPEEQMLDQVCRGIDHFILANDVGRLARIRTYWQRRVPQHLQDLAWDERQEAEIEARRAERAERKKAS